MPKKLHVHRQVMKWYWSFDWLDFHHMLTFSTQAKYVPRISCIGSKTRVVSKLTTLQCLYFIYNIYVFLAEVSFQLSACSDRGSFANPHLGEFLTPWISPLDMIFFFVGWQRFSSCYVVISRLEKPGNNNMRWPGFEPRSVAWPSALETITPRGHPLYCIPMYMLHTYKVHTYVLTFIHKNSCIPHH